MVWKGKVNGGVVVVNGAKNLPEGAEVQVRLVKNIGKKRSSLSAKLLKWAGRAKGLPRDLAENHDHYLHGRPKR